MTLQEAKTKAGVVMKPHKAFLAAHDAEPFHDECGQILVNLLIDERRYYVPLDSQAFGDDYRDWTERSGDKREDLTGARSEIRRSLHRSPEAKTRETFARVGHDDEAIYLDLGGPDQRVARIAADGLTYTTDSPIPFRRGRQALPLPQPVTDGRSVLEFRKLLPPSLSERDFHQLLGLLFIVLNSKLDCPLLVIRGPKSSGKTVTSWMIRQLVDPQSIAEGSIPKCNEDFALALNNSRVYWGGNLSRITSALSDLLCQACTGGSVRRRKIYTNSEEIFLRLRSMVILNSINPLVKQADLKSRSYEIDLAPIVDAESKPTLMAEFEAARGEFLGSLLQAMVRAMIDPAPRWAGKRDNRFRAEEDWVRSCFLGLGLDPDCFSHAIRSAQEEHHDEILDHWAAWPFVQSLADREGGCLMTSGEMLIELNRLAGDSPSRIDPTWPTTAEGLGSTLRQYADAMRARGYERVDRRTGKARWHYLQRIETAIAE